MLSVVEVLDLLDQVTAAAKQRNFADVVDLLEGLPETEVVGQPELGHFLAQAYSHIDRQDDADALLDKLEENAEGSGNDRLFRRRQNLMAVACIRRGELSRARGILLDVQLASQVAGDETFLATATMNLGVLADMRCDWSEALVHYHYALVIFQKLGDRASMAGLYHNLGMLYRQAGDLDEAEAYFNRALENYQPDGTLEERVATEIERALSLVDRRDATGGLHLVRKAKRTAKQLQNERLLGECLRAEGKVLLALSRVEDAEELLRDALLMPAVKSNLLLRAEIYEELAVAAIVRGDIADSDRQAERAERFFRRLGVDGRCQIMRRRLNEAAQWNLISEA